MAGNVSQQAMTAIDRNDGSGRAGWLRERLAELAENLGRSPNKIELTSFIHRYQVDLTEIDALVGRTHGNLPAQRASASVRGHDSAAIPAARKSVEPATPRSTIPLRSRQTAAPASSITATDPESPPTPAAPSDRAVSRAVEDLVDDWYRGGRELHYDDVARLTTKRGLSAQQTAEILEELAEQGVEVADLQAERGVDDRGSDDAAGSAARWRPSTAVSDLARAYLLKIGKYPLIWAEDEVRLGRQIQLGLAADLVLADESRRSSLSEAQLANLHDASAAGRRAHSAMVCANLRLVVSIAKHRSYEGSGVEFIDRIQDGNGGLMRAAEKFDPSLGLKFSTYATWWIRQAVGRGIGDRGRLVRIPIHVHEKLGSLRRARRDLVGRLGREPSTAELAESLEWSAATVQAMIDFSRPLASLDALVGTEGDTTLGDLLADRADVDGRTDPVNCVIESACVRDIDSALATLPERSANVIRRRYGLHGSPEQTLDEIGAAFGVTRERIRQIESKAMAHLQSCASTYGLGWYLTESDAETPPTPQTPSKRAARGRPRHSPLPSVPRGTPPPLPEWNPPPRAEIARDQFLYESIADIVDIG